MNGIKIKIILAATFVALFLAGGAVGLLAGRSAKEHHREPFSLVKDLGLTEEQQERMREIWTETMRAARQLDRERRIGLRDWRDDTILQLLTDDQLVLYDEIQREYDRRLEELNAERRDLFIATSERSKDILTESQKKIYEDLVEDGGGFFPQRTRGGRDSE